MNKNNKDIFDTIDEYFSQINHDEIAKKISEGVESITKNISVTIEDSLKSNGYNNWNEFVQGEIKDQKGKKPTPKKFFNEYTSRKEYVLEAIKSVDYEIKYRGYYKEGHLQALTDIYPLVEKYASILDELRKQIIKQIKEIKSNSNTKKAYYNGYIGGCEYVIKAIMKSQQVMMDQIIKEMC